MGLAPSVRLPDLWLKFAMATALIPPGSQVRRLQNEALARGVRGDIGGYASTFSQWIAGDALLRRADDLHFFAAMIEVLILAGIRADWSRKTVKDYVDDHPRIGLESALEGTFIDFAQGLLDVVARRSDFDALGGAPHFRKVLVEVIHRELHDGLSEATDRAGTIKVLHGRTRDWIADGNRSERIARKRSPDCETVVKGSFIQFLIPPSLADQRVFGFELRADEGVIDHPWPDVGAWIAPRYQQAGKALMLLDEPFDDQQAYEADVIGEFWVQAIAVDVEKDSAGQKPGEHIAALPSDLRRLTTKIPDWPQGYAESMASVTFARRLLDQQKKATSKHERAIARAKVIADAVMPDEFEPPKRARLFRTRYRVVEAE